MQRRVQGDGLAEDHAHCEGGSEFRGIDYMKDRRGCNDAGSILIESNRDPCATSVDR